MKNVFEIVMVFITGYMIGKMHQKEKCTKCAAEPNEKKVNAEYKDGKVIVSFGETK